MNDSIFRNGGVVKWTQTIAEAELALANMPSKVWRFSYVIKGHMGWGKSTFLEFLEDNFDGNFVEGDIMLMLAIALDQKIPTHYTLSEYAKGIDGGESPWEQGLSKTEKAQLVKKHLGKFLTRIDIATGFHGYEARTQLLIIPDYKQYVEQLKKRTAVMLSERSGSYREHVRKTHVALSFTDFSKMILSRLEEHDLTFVIPNIKSDAVWKSLVESLLKFESLRD